MLFTCNIRISNLELFNGRPNPELQSVLLRCLEETEDGRSGTQEQNIQEEINRKSVGAFAHAQYLRSLVRSFYLLGVEWDPFRIPMVKADAAVIIAIHLNMSLVTTWLMADIQSLL